ncbi:MAG: hypothetical protein H6550_16130 [Chitinophagales bacterium]|nr:hypothetical protein [Chitinophagales bacterium]
MIKLLYEGTYPNNNDVSSKQYYVITRGMLLDQAGRRVPLFATVGDYSPSNAVGYVDLFFFLGVQEGGFIVGEVSMYKDKLHALGTSDTYITPIMRGDYDWTQTPDKILTNFSIISAALCSGPMIDKRIRPLGQGDIKYID